MKTLVISTNLNPLSKTNIIAKEACKVFEAKEYAAEYLPLSDLTLPICDGYDCYKDPSVIQLQEKIASYEGLVLCSPIYCYDLNAVAKNLIELTGFSWKNKVVSIIVTAGAEKSYMAPVKFASSLMLDFRCLVLPRYLYVTSTDFDKNNQITNSDINKRLDQLVDTHINIQACYK